MKKICNIVCDITGGGVESVLINYFSHLDRSNYTLDLLTYGITSEICAKRFKDLGFNIITIPPKRNGFFKSVMAMNDVLKKNKYDIVHAHLTEWNCIPMVLGWRNKIKIRISHSHMADFPQGIAKRVLLKIQRFFILKFATKLCACGQAAAEYLYGKIKAEKVQIINNAIDVKRFVPNKEVRNEVRKELGLSGSTFCVGHVGRFVEQKNHFFLIDIFFNVLKFNPNSCLLLLGTGPLEKEVLEKVERLGLLTNVKFLGITNTPERIYQAFDVFCLPSLYEGFPVVALEMQSLCIPSLLSDYISKEVIVTPFISMMNLKKDDAGKWAAKICSIKNKINMNFSSFPKDYDINYSSKLWSKLYNS